VRNRYVWVVALAGLLGAWVGADEPKPDPKKPQWQRMLTGDDAKQAAKLQQRIGSLDANEDFAGAIQVAEQLLALRTKLQGEDHYETVTLKQEILPALRKTLELTNERRRGWLMALNGAVESQQLLDVARSAEAISKLRTYLKWCRDVLGEEHPGTATSYNNLAFRLDALGKHSEAQPLFQRALDIRRKTLGENHPDTAASCSQLALNLDAQGKLAESLPLYQLALDTFRLVLGEEHPHTATVYNNLAVNLSTQGKYAEALQQNQKSLEIHRKVSGEDSYSIATSYNNLAMDLYNQGKYFEAQPLLQKALDIRRKIVGEEHRGIAEIYQNLALNLEALGNHAEAQRLYQKVLDINRKVLGEEHPYTALSYSSLAFSLVTQAMHAEAQPLAERALEINLKVLGEEHIYTATSYNILAANWAAQGKHAEAQRLYQKALDITRKILGEEHPRTATSYVNLASILIARGKLTEAEALLDRAVHSYESSRLLGASGLDRASLRMFNPRVQLAILQQGQDPARAWQTVELSLARALLDQQATRDEPVSTPSERAEQIKQRQRLAELQPHILFLVAKRSRTEAEAAMLESLLKQRREAEERLMAIDATVSQRQVADGAAIRKALPADAALVFWIDSANRSVSVQELHWVCVVRSTGDPKWERLSGIGPDLKWSATDSLLSSRLVFALGGSESVTPIPVCLRFPLVWAVEPTTVRAPPAPRSEVDALVKHLRALRLEPVLKHLDGVKTLYVVPTGLMAGVPVELLAPEFTVSYVPSGTFLARAKDRATPAGDRVLALGDPIFTRPGDKPAAELPLPPGGLLIIQVAQGGAAANANLKPGDVLLKYGDAEVNDLKSLDAAMAAQADSKSIPLRVWRADADKPFTRDVAPGRLGVVLANDPAPVVLANRRKTDALLAALRGGNWADLPGTRVEVERLRKLFGDRTTVLTDSAASEQKLDALRKSGDLAKYRYLHLATHGQGNTVRAMESCLILAQDQLPQEVMPKAGEPMLDGRLTAREVLDYWKLDAELVTLSACETAIGRDGGGDGLLGFAQAFLVAGSRAVCLSLWRVDDTATALLMDRFYQNLLGKREGLKGPLGKAAALDEAKAWLRELTTEEVLERAAVVSGGVTRGDRAPEKALKLKAPAAEPGQKGAKPFAHPRYWAAFILIGDPN
jgi:tetratricopeptide (TPR) repeat protein